MSKHVRSHIHKQEVPSALWTISHGLFCNPTVSVRVMHEGVLTGILPLDIRFPDENTVVVEFSSARTGEVRLA